MVVSGQGVGVVVDIHLDEDLSLILFSKYLKKNSVDTETCPLCLATIKWLSMMHLNRSGSKC